MAETNGNAATPTQSAAQQTQTPPPSQAATVTAAAASGETTLEQQASSLSDTGLAKRPRDARLIHMILANLGITAYQERVPLQLLDFCYRYTSATLTDALHLTSEFAQSVTGTGKIVQGGGSASADPGAVSLAALKLSVASRTHYQFSPTLSKEYLQELAAEKNRVALPAVGRDWGLRLPPERYCLTGVGYALKEEWDSEGEEEEKENGEGDAVMGDADETGEGEDGDTQMEDLFGSNMAGDGSKDA